VLAGPIGYSTQAATPGYAEVRSIKHGSAEYSEDDTTWKPLTIGLRLGSGQSVKTDAQASVDLFLEANGPAVRLCPGTVLRLTTLTVDRVGQDTVIQTELALPQGRILGQVKEVLAASKYEVATPKGVFGIRGPTRYDLSANGKAVVSEGNSDHTAHGGERLNSGANRSKP